MPKHIMQILKDSQMSGSCPELPKSHMLFVVLTRFAIFIVEQHPNQQYRSMLWVLIECDQLCVQHLNRVLNVSRTKSIQYKCLIKLLLVVIKTYLFSLVILMSKHLSNNATWLYAILLSKSTWLPSNSEY